MAMADRSANSSMTIPYTTVRRPGRKTASIAVSPDNTVIVTVPSRLGDAEVAALVRRKNGWIQKKITINSEVRHPYRRKEYVSGEAFSYLGRNYRLKIETGDEPGVALRGGRLYVRGPAGLARKERDSWVVAQLTAWYRDRALEKVRQRARLHAQRMGVESGPVGIMDYRRQWGSCYLDTSVHFNWKIAMAPVRIIDYVVIHELCHLRHHDHSKAFWKMLALYLPDYAERKEWLRVNGGLLTV